MSPKVDAKRICEVLRLIDQGLGYSDSVAEFERKWCINMWLAEEIEVDNTPLIRLTDLGMGCLTIGVASMATRRIKREISNFALDS